MPQVLPVHYFSSYFSPKYKERFYEILNKYKFEDTKLTFADFDHKIETLRQHIINYFVNTLDIDVSNRLLGRNKIHFQDSKLFEETNKQLNETIEKIRGYYSVNTHHIFLSTMDKEGELRSDGSLLKSLCHELIHSVSYKYYDIIKTDQKREIFLMRQGFGSYDKNDNQDWEYMMEGYTEIVISEICRTLIKNDKLLLNDFKQAYSGELTGYWDNVIILRAVIDKGKTQGTNGQEFFDNLGRDFLLGETNGLRTIENTIGKDCFNIYKDLVRKNRKIKEIIEIAESLKLNEFVSKVKEIPDVEIKRNVELFKILGVVPTLTD